MRIVQRRHLPILSIIAALTLLPMLTGCSCAENEPMRSVSDNDDVVPRTFNDDEEPSEDEDNGEIYDDDEPSDAEVLWFDDAPLSADLLTFDLVAGGAIGYWGTSAVVDSEDRLVVAAIHGRTLYLFYPDDERPYERVVGMAEYPHLAIGYLDDAPRLVYHDPLRRQAGFAVRKDGVWSISTISGADRCSAIVQTNRTHAACTAGDEVRVYTLENVEWTYEVIESYAGDLWPAPALTFDSVGALHLAYMYGADELYTLRYATNFLGEWNVETVDTREKLSAVAIAINSHDQPGVAYLGENGGESILSSQVHFARRDGRGIWARYTIQDADHAPFISMAFLSEDRASIVYSNYYSDLEMIWQTDDGEGDPFFRPWDASRIHPALGTVWPNVVVDSEKQARVVYSSYEQLWQSDVAHWGFGEATLIQPSPTTALESGIAVTPSGDPRVAFEGFLQATPAWSAEYIRIYSASENAEELSGWERDVVVESPCGIVDPDLAIGPDGAEHISFGECVAAGEIKLAYATDRTGDWVVHRDEERGDQTAIAVGPGGTPHIAYARGREYQRIDLRYAAGSARGGLDLFPVFLDAAPLGPGAIDVDQSGNPHICHESYPYGVLSHAWLQRGHWQSETVADTYSWWCTLRIDANDHVHVLYENDVQKLVYANDASGTWVSEPVSDLREWGDFVLDDRGMAHIAAFHWPTREINYVTNASGSWTRRLIDRGDGLSGYISLAIAPDGMLHASWAGYGGIWHTAWPADRIVPPEMVTE
ncbi:hypothetical protein K8I61_16200 [bacterium]|nr:hypothetical protein [bacterium]